LAPAESEFGEAVQQQKERAAFGFAARFQHMHAQAVDAVDVARADGRRERDVEEGGHDISSSWPGIAVRRTASLTLAYARPSTSSVLRDCKDVDARDKPGHDADSVGWAKPTGRANARPMTGSACPPVLHRTREGGRGASAPSPTLRFLLFPL